MPTHVIRYPGAQKEVGHFITHSVHFKTETDAGDGRSSLQDQHTIVKAESVQDK